MQPQMYDPRAQMYMGQPGQNIRGEYMPPHEGQMPMGPGGAIMPGAMPKGKSSKGGDHPQMMMPQEGQMYYGAPGDSKSHKMGHDLESSKLVAETVPPQQGAGPAPPKKRLQTNQMPYQTQAQPQFNDLQRVILAS